LSSLGERFLDHSVNLADPDTYLGIVFGAVFVASLVVIALMTARGGWPDGQRARTIRAAIIGAAFAFAIGSFGGVGSIVAHLVSPQIRVWSRITPFLAFFCAIVAVLVIDWVRHRLAGRKGGRIAAMGLPVMIAAVGVLDQTSPAFAPDHVANARLWRETANFVHEVEGEMPIGASVLQLPLIPFPEAGPVNSMGGYDHLMGYLHSRNLRWSAAAMKGRPGDWQTQAIENDLSSRIVILNAAAAGFDGVWVDRNGYADQGQRVEATITALAGVQLPLVSPTGRIAFYDLRPLRRRLARNHSTRAIAEGGVALTSPITAAYDEGFTPVLSNTTDQWRWAAHTARLVLRNPSRATHIMRWTGWLQATPGARITVSAGGRRLFAAVLTTGRMRMRVRISAAPGDTVVSVTSTGTNQAPPGSAGVLSLDVINARLLDTTLIQSP
jgi:phosphoglycerol transferase